MKQTETQVSSKETDHYPKNYWDAMNRLGALAMALCLALAWLPDIPEAIQAMATEYLFRVPLIWLVLVAIPWIVKRWWQRRGQMRSQDDGRSISSDSGGLSAVLSKVKTAATSHELHVPRRIGRIVPLPVPLERLPINPNPEPSAPLTVQSASETITTSLQLAEFSLDEDVQVLKVESGPVLQMISFQLPQKVQLSKLVSKKDDIANHLGSQQGFDVRAAKNFKSAASFVIPHAQENRAYVYMRDLAADLITFAKQAVLPVIFGKDVHGQPILFDLVKMPHLLVCGATGSGKSVFVNTLLTSMVSMRSPDQVKLLLIDPKQVEFGVYKGLPHLLAPPVTNMKRAVKMFSLIIEEMEQRYERFAATSTRNLSSYNVKHPNDQLPSIVVVIDEYADLILTAGDVIEDAVQRITQKARAAGIHLILGTQRPSVNVVTGTIKANLPSRVTFKLPNTRDYMTVLDRGAPQLLGFGDGVCMVQGGELQRFQSATISVKDGEDTDFVEELITYWQDKGQKSSQEWTTSDQDEDLEQTVSMHERKLNKEDELDHDSASSLDTVHQSEVTPDEDESTGNGSFETTMSKGKPQMQSNYDRALKIVESEGGFAVSSIQRFLRISFSDAATMAERMMEEGIIGPYDSERKMRPLLRQKQERTQEELLDQLRLYICQTQITQSAKLREILGVQRETVLELMRSLVQEGFLLPPVSTKLGYKIAWDDEQVAAYVFSHQAD